MSEAVTNIMLPGLTNLEVDELTGILEAEGANAATAMQVETEAGDVGDQYGEPFTILAVLALGQITMNALVIYLAKGRKRSTKKVHVRHRYPNGEEVEYTLEVEVSSEEAIRADLMKQIAALKIPMPKDLGLGDANA